MKKKNVIWKILLSLFALGLIIGIVLLVKDYRDQKAAEAALEELARQAAMASETQVQESSQPEVQEETETETVEEPSILEILGIEVPEKNLDFADLQANTNPDIYAWLYIPNTKIDYPVLQHPTDDAYYLEYNMDGSKGRPGCIYTELINSKEFDDPNTVLYGHNMRNGTMFADLHLYEDAQFLEENPYFYIYTPDKTYVYEIFAAYEYSYIHLIKSFDLGNPEVFQNYLDQIFEIRDMNANIRNDITVTSDNHIVTLSTCARNKPNIRYLVQGVLVNDESAD